MYVKEYETKKKLRIPAYNVAYIKTIAANAVKQTPCSACITRYFEGKVTPINKGEMLSNKLLFR